MNLGLSNRDTRLIDKYGDRRSGIFRTESIMIPLPAAEKTPTSLSFQVSLSTGYVQERSHIPEVLLEESNGMCVAKIAVLFSLSGKFDQDFLHL